jgi:hypothetical protein
MNTAEQYMTTRKTLDDIANSMTSGPTIESVALLRSLMVSVSDLYAQAVVELTASQAREQRRLDLHPRLRDLAHK